MVLIRGFSEVNTSFALPPDNGDDSVFCDSDGTNGRKPNYNMRRLVDQPANQENERDVSHAHIEDLASKSQEKAGNHTSTYWEKLHPLELLIRLFPTQRRSSLELILKGYHGEVLRAIECV